MKKTYISPIATAISLETEAMLAYSDINTNDGETTTPVIGGDGSDASNRRHSIWSNMEN